MDAERTEITSARIVWKLKAPANWTEIGKVFGIARHELGKNSVWDDVVWVECHDEEVWITYDKALVAPKSGDGDAA